MANAPELVPQEADKEVEVEVEVDELTAALEGTQETDKPKAEESKVETTKKEGEEGEEGKEGEEGEVKTEGEEGKTKTEKEPTEVDPLEEMRLENRELRSILRQTKKDMSLLKAQVGRADQKATAALDEDGEVVYKEEFTPVEQLTSAIQQIGDERGAQLDLLAETMSEMTKYADIYEVCSPDNFADMFDAIGRGIAQEQGISLEEAALRAEYTVWQQKNPYKYMYNIIKEHHPKYAKTETTPVAKPAAEAKEVKSEKKPTEAPASIAGMGGGDTSKSGWTAAKIDALPEEELDKVPADVYNKYLQGTLK